MTRLTTAVTAVLAVIAGLLVLPAPAQASGLWTIVTASSSTTTMPRDGGTKTFTVSCPSGYTPISGHINPYSHDDLRRLSEFVEFGSGAAYTVSLVDYTAGYVGGYTIPMSVTVRCVSMSVFTGSATVFGSFTVGANHLAQGTKSCGAGYGALSASIQFSSTGETLLTSTPTSDLTGWSASGWNDVVGSAMWMWVHCVPTADLSGMRVYTHSDAAGWDTSATATCASGLVPATGGTQHVGGDGGGFTEELKPTANGWASRAFSTSGGSFTTTAGCVPSAVPTVHVAGAPTPDPNSTDISWTFYAEDPAAAGGYSISYTCQVSDGGGWQNLGACTSPLTQTSMSEGSHQLNVTALTSDGRSSSATRSVTVDTTAPSVTFTDGNPAAYSTTTPTAVLEVQDALSRVTSLVCGVDGADPTPCGQGTLDYYCLCNDYTGTQNIGLAELTEGNHVLHVEATDEATNVISADLDLLVDTTAPTAKLTAPIRRFTVGSKIRAAWSGADSGSGLAAFQGRWMSAPYDGGFGSWSSPLQVDAGVTHHDYGPLGRGATYCFAARSVDLAGNMSGWTGQKCSAIPLDDRDLVPSDGWTVSSPSGWFRHTALATSTKGATLKVGGATLKRIALVAQVCPTCGTVGVFVGGVKVGSFDLSSSKQARKLLQLPAFSLRTGQVAVRVLTQGKLVKVDALGLSRT